MVVRLLILLGLLVPAVALAQPAAQREVSLELVASGTVTVPASKFTMSIEISATGDSQAKADANRDDKRADVAETLGKLGIPAAALTVPPKSFDAPMFDPMAATSVVADSMEAGAEKPSFTSNMTLSLVLTSADQVIAAREAIAKMDRVTAGAVVSDVGDREGLYRQAKIKALSSARADADAYASAMGLHVVRIAKISESGNGMFPPGFQNLFQRMMTAGGPAGMRGMFESVPGTVRIDAALSVEFVLAP
jgi:uncharacterized protein YggE